MNESKNHNSSYVGYEYKEITVPRVRAAFYLDGYESFGWQMDERITEANDKPLVTLHLRRDRKIMNKMELTRLQRNFEASVEEIDALEASKKKMPQIAALTIGVIGTVFMAGSTFAVTAAPPIIWLCVLLAIPGIIGWTLPYFIYNRLLKKRIDIVTPLIEQKNDEIYELCRKGSDLLN